MMSNLKLIKDWCDKNINRVAWQRIGLEIFDELSDEGFDFDQLDDPKASDTISESVFNIINDKIIEIYQKSIDKKEVGV